MGVNGVRGLYCRFSYSCCRMRAGSKKNSDSSRYGSQWEELNLDPFRGDLSPEEDLGEKREA